MEPVWWLAGKVAFYCAMAGIAVPWLRLKVASVPGFTLAYGAFRLAVGLLSGLVILLLYGAISQAGHKDAGYFLSFGLIRYFEWLLVLWIIADRTRTRLWTMGWRGQAWILVGVAGNVAFDRIAVIAGFTDFKGIHC
jgi:hypothetical protein